MAKAATCINSGSHAGKKCTVCGDITQGCAIIPALGHNYIKDETRSVEPTCELEGKFYGTCDRCGDVKDELLPAMGHYEEVTPGTPADCTLGGVSDGKTCKVCGKVTAEPQQTEPLGHDFVLNLIKSKPATCLQNGYDYLQCTRCKAIDRRETSSNGHNYSSDWQTIVQPTCTQTGVAIKICKDCLTIETNTVDVMSHTDVNFDGKCDMCGITGGFVAENCSCNCHKTGLANMFFKFMLFFQKLFRVNKECQCGKAHY